MENNQVRKRLFESVDETTLLSELRVRLIGVPVGPLISAYLGKDNSSWCTVYANVILAVLTLHLRHHRDHRKWESEWSTDESIERRARCKTRWAQIQFYAVLHTNNILQQLW